MNSKKYIWIMFLLLIMFFINANLKLRELLKIAIFLVKFKCLSNMQCKMMANLILCKNNERKINYYVSNYDLLKAKCFLK